ncbi:hypothetical protein PYCCODRAFT_784641 [Trametes coccinea BRFM310]|uniref:Uncharacterized protein n=1 Tax=Trametes coccinea (strain BRFM310) TaxID=1353009 RepID=A0A1Y2J0R5_TRAC3|nr:hypothetical protein PYCCODRAFT_784641 [Trametes coccinea BRFM310]
MLCLPNPERDRPSSPSRIPFLLSSSLPSGHRLVSVLHILHLSHTHICMSAYAPYIPYIVSHPPPPPFCFCFRYSSFRTYLSLCLCLCVCLCARARRRCGGLCRLIRIVQNVSPGCTTIQLD